MAVVDFDYGSDANDGSFDNPFATLRHALSVVKPDETIFIVLREDDSKFTVQTGGIVEETGQGELRRAK